MQIIEIIFALFAICFFLIWVVCLGMASSNQSALRAATVGTLWFMGIFFVSIGALYILSHV